jgi:hypothetical protein
MDIYEEHLRMWLFEEQRPVSYSYLGFEISVSSNTAKQYVLFCTSVQSPHANLTFANSFYVYPLSECCGNLQPITPPKLNPCTTCLAR